MGLGDLLKILEQASASQSSGSSSDADPLSDLLGSLLGGGTQATPSRSSRSSGSRRASSASNATSNDPLAGMLTPIVEELAKKIGLPPEMAQMVVTFALSQLMNSQAAASSNSADVGSVLAQSRGMLSNADGGLEPAGLVQRLSSGQSVDANFLQSTGMAQQLASQTGMDAQTAANSLQQVFSMLGGTPPEPSSAPPPLFGKAGGSTSGAESKPPSKTKATAKKSSTSKSHKK